MMNERFSITRLGAVIRKEFIQMRRDRMTFAMIIGIPLMQLILFGYAINTDPKHLPTAVVCADHSHFARSICAAMQVSEYFHLIDRSPTEATARRLMDEGGVQFVLTIPEDFERDLLRGDYPAMLLEADATDPSSVGNAIAAMNTMSATILNRDLRGPLRPLQGKTPPYELISHRLYNPERDTQDNIVPGLLGVILTLTMVFITSLAITRETERGTMENLLATPVRPLEVMVGKIIPYIFVGYIQMLLILLGAKFLFDVPMIGSVTLLVSVAIFFLAANLAVGVTFSTIARNQLQAVQLSIFFFLPSLLLSGFMFPFRGMPIWAQCIGYVFPLTHFLPIVRGILLKGNGWPIICMHLWPIILFMCVVMLIGVKRYRQTLD